jgi:hypothetical protein
MGRRLDAAQLRAGRRSGRGLRQTARDGRGGGTRSASIGIDTRTTVGIHAEVEWRETVRFWKSCGVTHLTLGTFSGRGHLRRIDGRTLADHLAAIKRYWNAAADLL